MENLHLLHTQELNPGTGKMNTTYIVPTNAGQKLRILQLPSTEPRILSQKIMINAPCGFKMVKKIVEVGICKPHSRTDLAYWPYL